MKFNSLNLIILFLLFSCNTFAQKGFIRGDVFDESTGETLPGVTIYVVGPVTTGAITDLDGVFNLELPVGTYSLRVSYISYETIEVNDVHLTEGKVTLFENIALKEVSTKIEGVTITANVIRNTESALLTIKRKSANLIDGISAANLRKIGDSDAATSIKRVPGVSVQDGRYVFVRGLGDRYTKTILNGLDIPGLDPDRNTIQLDIFPTNVIDNILVFKTFSADLPADFTGGVVNIEIKDFPDEKTGEISLSGGYNPDFHLNSNFLTYEGGKTDLLGYDDGTRKIPADNNIPDFNSSFVDFPGGTNAARYSEILRDFNSNMAAERQKSLMDFGLGFILGNQKILGKYTLGYNASLSYKNESGFYDNVEYGRYKLSNEPSVYELDIADVKNGELGVQKVFLSGLAGLALKSQNSKLRLYFLRLQNGEKKASILDVSSNDVGSEYSGFQHNLEYNQRSITNVLIDGKHTLVSGNWEIIWKFSPTFSRIYDPDIRFARYVYGSTPEDLEINNESGSPTRIWRDLNEKNYSGVTDVTRNIQFLQEDAKIKFGGACTYKERDFEIKPFTINVRQGSEDFTSGNPNELFFEENLWPRNNNPGLGTTYEQDFVVDNPNEFNANANYFAGYTSFEFSVIQNLKTIIGARYESFVQKYTGRNRSKTINLDNEKVLDNSDIFPSVNLIYGLTEKMNLRFSYTKTIARPSFKEMSYAVIIDPISEISFVGGLDDDFTIVDGDTLVLWDGKLQSTYIHNFDIRWEWFHGRNNMASISAFYKAFDKPIEMVQYSRTQKTWIQPRNVGDGKVYGLELELRQNLDALAISLQNFSLIGNLTFLKSEIQRSSEELRSRKNTARLGETIDEYRKMAGLPPYIINVGLSFNGGEQGFWDGLVAGLYYNMQGQTLEVVGIGAKPDIYTQPFHSLNFNANKAFGRNNCMSVGLKIENILGDDMDAVFKSFRATDQIYSHLSTGTKFTLRFGYRIF